MVLEETFIEVLNKIRHVGDKAHQALNKIRYDADDAMGLTLDINTKLHRRSDMFCFALVYHVESPIEVDGRVITILAATTLGVVFNIHSLS